LAATSQVVLSTRAPLRGVHAHTPRAFAYLSSAGFGWLCRVFCAVLSCSSRDFVGPHIAPLYYYCTSNHRVGRCESTPRKRPHSACAPPAPCLLAAGGWWQCHNCKWGQAGMAWCLAQLARVCTHRCLRTAIPVCTSLQTACTVVAQWTSTPRNNREVTSSKPAKCIMMLFFFWFSPLLSY